jgi:hypothetical protein
MNQRLKKKNTIHNAARSPDLVGIYKTMWDAELQDHILKRRRLYCPDKTTNRQQQQTMGKKKTLAKA